MKKILLVLILLLTACSSLGGSCSKSAIKETSSDLSDIFERWVDADKITSSTSRISLSGPISDLQQIKRDASNLEVPECMSLAQDYLVGGMENAIDGYLAFMSQEDDDTVMGKFNASATQFSLFTKEIDNLLNEGE